jgi:hypothetical protein
MERSSYSKSERWRKARQLRSSIREKWYLETGPTSDEWRAMSPAQKAIYQRWLRYYRRRRSQRNLLMGKDLDAGYL